MSHRHGAKHNMVKNHHMKHLANIEPRIEPELCKGKRKYISRDEARDFARRVSHSLGAHQRPYRCPGCNLYHLTTVE